MAPKKDGIGGTGSVFCAWCDVATGLAEIAGTGEQLLVVQREAADPTLRRFDHCDGRIGDVDADAVAADDGDTKLRIGHLCFLPWRDLAASIHARNPASDKTGCRRMIARRGGGGLI